MTKCEKKFINIIKTHYPDITVDDLFGILCKTGILDTVRMRAVVIREEVRGVMAKNKVGITQAMQSVADDNGTSYEAVRKYQYYYTECDIIKPENHE